MPSPRTPTPSPIRYKSCATLSRVGMGFSSSTRMNSGLHQRCKSSYPENRTSAMRAGPQAIFRVRTVSITARPSETATQQRATGLSPTIADHIHVPHTARGQSVPAFTLPGNPEAASPSGRYANSPSVRIRRAAVAGNRLRTGLAGWRLARPPAACRHDSSPTDLSSTSTS
jgi:hypothetical protein